MEGIVEGDQVGANEGRFECPQEGVIKGKWDVRVEGRSETEHGSDFDHVSEGKFLADGSHELEESAEIIAKGTVEGKIEGRN